MENKYKTKTIKVDYMTHKLIKQLQKRLKFKRIGSVIEYLLNGGKNASASNQCN